MSSEGLQVIQPTHLAAAADCASWANLPKPNVVLQRDGMRPEQQAKELAITNVIR